MFKSVVRWSSLVTRCYSTQVDKNALSKLRKKTGIAFINCKKALIKFNNNVEEAEKWLKEQAKKEGWAKATKLQDRRMAQGLIGLVSEKSHVTLIEVNCETDFVARTDKFQNFVANLSTLCHEYGKELTETKSLLLKNDLTRVKAQNESTLGDLVAMEIGNIGENMQLRRALIYKATEELPLSYYVYGVAGKSLKLKNCQLGKYGAIVQFSQFQNGRKVTPGQVVCQQIGQHIVGMNPQSIGDFDDIKLEKEKLEKEENQIDEQSVELETKNQEEAKVEEHPDDQEEQQAPPRVEKEETRLIFQDMLTEPDTPVYEILVENNVIVKDFVRFEVGEELSEEAESENSEQTASVAS